MGLSLPQTKLKLIKSDQTKPQSHDSRTLYHIDWYTVKSNLFCLDFIRVFLFHNSIAYCITLISNTLLLRQARCILSIKSGTL